MTPAASSAVPARTCDMAVRHNGRPDRCGGTKIAAVTGSGRGETAMCLSCATAKAGGGWRKRLANRGWLILIPAAGGESVTRPTTEGDGTVTTVYRKSGGKAARSCQDCHQKAAAWVAEVMITSPRIGTVFSTAALCDPCKQKDLAARRQLAAAAVTAKEE